MSLVPVGDTGTMPFEMRGVVGNIYIYIILYYSIIYIIKCWLTMPFEMRGVVGAGM